MHEHRGHAIAVATLIGLFTALGLTIQPSDPVYGDDAAEAAAVSARTPAAGLRIEIHELEGTTTWTCSRKEETP